MASIQPSTSLYVRSMPLCSTCASPNALKQSLSLNSRRSFSWWWKRGTTDWSSNLDDSFQRHLLRKERLLRYKYSKAIRRRQLWDRDPSHNASRPSWVGSTTALSDSHDGQASSSHSSQSDSSSIPRTTGRQSLDDFAHFKACVDRDPFGAVFGRRLASPQNLTNTSWSSFSWILKTPSSKESQVATQESAMSNTPPSPAPGGISSSNIRTASQSDERLPGKDNHRSAPTTKPSTRPIDSTEQQDEYEYDPISMRKVLKTKPVMQPPVQAFKPLFDPLFAEKGMDIPVKPYKPHRVFGYSAKSSSKKACSDHPASDTQALELKAETSRLAELRKLKAATLGNSIDTTAEYHGKWVSPAEKAENRSRTAPATESTTDEAPLFSGTTYEAKSKDIFRGIASPKQDWLNREGFGPEQGSPTTAIQPTTISDAGNAKTTSSAKLQPSLDRLQAIPQPSDRLKPSLDRLTASSKKPTTAQTSPKQVETTDEAHESISEDLDLLRASDIRASTRTSRRSKQDSEKAKQDQRQKLETDFNLRQKDDDGLSIVFPEAIMKSSKRLSESLNSLWHRLWAQQPASLIEKVQPPSTVENFTVGNLGTSANRKEQGGPVADAKIAPKALESATSSIQTFTPSKEVLDAEQKSKERTLALRKARIEAMKQEAEMKEKEKALAQTIKATYEDEYGPITVDHRQHKGLARIDQLAETIKEANIRADRNAIKDMIARCEHALRDAKLTRVEVTQKLKAILARLPSSKVKLHPPPVRMTPDPRSFQPASKENVAAKKPAEQPVLEAQQTSSTTQKTSSGKAPLLYKVLAYDSSTLQMNIAETTSSMSATGDGEMQPLHPTEVLSRLNNVAKFLPYFADMEKQGYEIVSGSGDVLVFKRVRTPMISSGGPPQPSSTAMEDSSSSPSPSSQTSSPAETVVESIAPNASASKVHRQESVFSGSGQTWHQEDTGSNSSSNKASTAEPGWFGRAVKRVFLAGTLTAAVAYTIGVVAEHAGAQVQVQGQEGSGSGRPRRVGRAGIYSTEDSR
ncbi:hypothetical protein EPUS_03183 [Endocarpon pusillum Z07020]|uniref:Uncharacterized protein n=1 Tax=Endocarpon pusillum (strain Z07020 / HMAS-L-300199) TaxID=1263415 RepID=U1HZ30_ENDPU|nr:uncharacterized protein EPUS_03183 [Endocarpon pusillum Z07020]ERF74799.1 hypothetical protein EPUS_03183 [Endocarpon pusillum Z07020]